MKTNRVLAVLIIAVIAAGLIVAACNPVAPVAPQGIGVTTFNGDVVAAQKFTVKGATSVQGLTVNGALSGAAVSVSSLTVDSVAQTGAIKYGSQASVISGTTIAHGIGTTPTFFLVNNDGIQATTFTQTLYHGNCGTVSCTVYVTAGSVTTFTVDWAAGK